MPPRQQSNKDAAAKATRTNTAPLPQSEPEAAPETRSSVRLLERAIDLLEALEKNGEPVGVRALETLTGIPRATSQRLLDAFDRRGYVQKDRGRYSMGAGMVRLARAYLGGDSMVTVAMPTLQALAALSGETTALYVRQGHDRLLVQRVESPHPLRHNQPIGERLPLHLGASGQILCMEMDDAELDAYLEEIGQALLASGSLLTKQDMLERTRQARLRGYAIAVDERFSGVSAVAAPVTHKARGVIAAVNIAGPTSRLAGRLEQLSIDVRNAGRDISEKLSHRY